MLFLRLALLNIGKYRRRSTVIVISVALSMVVMVFVSGMLGGLRKSFFANLVQQSGHLQIHDGGWSKRLNPYSIRYLISNPEELIGRLHKDSIFEQDATNAEPLLQFGALLVNGNKNLAMAGIGVKPNTRFYGQVRTGMVKGSFLPSAEGGGIAVSESTARLLGLTLGSKVAVLVQDSSGSPYYLSYPVTGLFHSGVSEIDDSAFFVTLSAAQQLLNLPHRATEIRVTLGDANRAAAVASAIEPSLKKQGLSVETWRQINGNLVTLVDELNVFSFIIDLFIVIVAATVITNSILMTVFERISTFGTLRAIGLKRRQLFWMIVDEGLILGLIGSIIGLAIGLLPVLYFHVHGMNIGSLSSEFGTGTTFYTALTAGNGILDFVAGVLIAAGGTLYGALSSSRLSLIDSLRKEGA